MSDRTTTSTNGLNVQRRRTNGQVANRCDTSTDVALIENLEPEARSEWDGALRRVLNLGYESGNDGRMHESVISQEVLARAANLGLGITVTVYPLRDQR